MSVFSASLKGKRPQNEDCHDILLNINGNDKTRENVNYYGVYDGHSDGQGGKFVSNFLHKTLPDIFTVKREKSIYPIRAKTIEKIYEKIQSLLKTQYTTQSTRAGSTCLIAIHSKVKEVNYLTVINTGDSRCILCRYDSGVNHARDITKDHKPSSYEEKHRILSSGGKLEFDGYEWRVNGLSVSRSFGDITSTHVTNIPDIFKIRLLTKDMANKNASYDKFFVLACDGLWDVLTSQEVINFILEKCYTIVNTDKGNIIDKRNNKLDIAKELAKFAIQKGSTDNVTVIVVFLD